MSPSDLMQENEWLRAKLRAEQRTNGQLRQLMKRYAPEVKWEPNPRYVRKGVFPFEKLAPELRNMVYGNLLVCDSPIVLGRELYAPAGVYRLVTYVERPARPWAVKFPGIFGPNGAALLCVNKAIYQEALSYLYESNVFLADRYTSFLQFMMVIGPGSKFVRDIGTRFWSEKNMRKLTVELTDDIIGKLTTFRVSIDKEPNKIGQDEGEKLIDSLERGLKPFVNQGESHAERRRRFLLLRFERDGSGDVHKAIRSKLAARFIATGVLKSRNAK